MEFPLTLSTQLGPHLKSLRKLRGLSQVELGKLVGVGQTRIADIEAEPGLVSIDQLMRICRALGAELILRTQEKVELRGHGVAAPSGTATHSSPPVTSHDDPDHDYLATMIGQSKSKLLDAMDAVGRELHVLLTSKTPIREIPQHAIAPLADKLDMSETTLARLLLATISRLDATNGTVLNRSPSKGSW